MDEIIKKHIRKGEDAELFRALTVIKPEKESWIKSQVERMREGATKSEINVAHFIDQMGVHFVSQAPFYDKGLDSVYIADFYIPRGHFIIEVDGGSHSAIGKMGKDLVRDEYFMKEGYRVIRIKNGETESPGKMAIILSDLIARVVLARKSQENNANKKALKSEPGGEMYEKLKIVLEYLEKANDEEVVVFRTAQHTVALQILDHRRGKEALGDIRWRINEVKRAKNLTVYALFRSKKSTQWMSRHPDNIVTRDNLIYTIKQPTARVIDLEAEYMNRKNGGSI